MKKFGIVLIVFFLIMAVVPAGMQNVYAQTLSKEQIIKSFNKLADYTLAVADSMPAEDYGYRPNHEIMTFAQQLNHIAGSNYYFSGTVLENPLPERKQLQATTKVQVMADLKESLDYVRNSLEAFDAKKFDEEMDWFGDTKQQRLVSFIFMVDHMTHHRGSCIIYLRSFGIAPPSFTGW